MDGEVFLLGVDPVLPIDMDEAMAMVAARDPTQPLEYVVSVNVQHTVLRMKPESGLAAAMDAAWLRLNDSRVLAKAHRFVTGQSIPLVTGSDMTKLMLDRGVIGPDDLITIIGGGPLIMQALREQYGLTRIAQHEPPMGYTRIPEARETAILFARDNPGRFLFVATGAPGAELLLAEMKARGDITGTGLAFGSALLFAVGLTKRAPEWMQKLSLEWLHRACSQPMRLGKRYARDLPPLMRLTWNAWRNERARRPS